MSVGDLRPTRRLYDAYVEQLDRPSLEKLRWDRLSATLSHAYHHSPYWRRRFEQAGVVPDGIRSIEQFRSVMPTMSKAEVLAAEDSAPPYGDLLALPRERVRSTCLTSGSSGHAQEVHAYSATDLAALSLSWGASFRWAGLEPGDNGFLMVPVGVTAGPASLYNAFHHYGLQTFAVAALDGEARLAMMRRFGAHFFSCGPIYLRRLTKICGDLGVDPRRDLPELKAVKLGTFGFSPSWAQEMQDFWGAHLIDTYASTQLAGGLASTCEQGVVLPDGAPGMLHFPEHRVLIEIVAPDTGDPVADGETGELIITPFDREAMPLIRFRTGDRVRRIDHRHCTCGRPFDGIEAGTVSRYDNMLKIRGMNLWTEAVDDIVLGRPDIAEYNGIVRVNEIGREIVEVHVLFRDSHRIDPQHRAQTLDDLARQIKANTNVAVHVTVGDPGTIRQIDYKERRWRDLRKENM